jgi:hypothetical protein
MNCRVHGCESTVKAKGLCRKHYLRQWRNGSPLILKRGLSGTGWSASGGYRGTTVGGVKKLDHVRIAESVLGKPLPPGAVVHHVNGIRHDNRPENLVICPDQGYHLMLHVRQRALEACGDASKRKCKLCKQYDSTENMSSYGSTHYHKKCAAELSAARRIQ